MVEEKSWQLKINLKIKPEAKGYFSIFIRKNWVNTGKAVICGIAFLFVKHSVFEWKRGYLFNSSLWEETAVNN